MPGMEPLRARFTIHTFELDAFGLLTAPALADLLAETAGQHATRLGVGLDALAARGLTWVLARQRVELLRAPGLHEEVEVETWPSGIDRLAALRDFRLRDAGGAEIARATSQWFVFDLRTRRPHPPSAVLDPERFQLAGAPRAATFSDGKLAALERWELERRFHVRYGDIDRNLHVNNGSYIGWAVEAVPRELWQTSRIADLEVAYRAECMLGSTVFSRSAAAPERGAGAFDHVIVREEDGKELARLTTRWVARG
jgi:acyl-ACP thioesterase